MTGQSLSRMRQSFPTVFARNLHRIMTARGWKQTPLSLEAGLSRSYIGEVFSGKTRSPGSDALRRIAEVLQCSPDDLMNEPAPPPAEPDYARHRLNRRRALEAAERAMGDGGASMEHAALVFSTAEMIYGLIVEREETLGRPIEDDDEDFWRLLDSMARRWMADKR
jgi:transcriptional regulator with XRE-family HTH domain